MASTFLSPNQFFFHEKNGTRDAGIAPQILSVGTRCGTGSGTRGGIRGGSMVCTRSGTRVGTRRCTRGGTKYQVLGVVIGVVHNRGVLGAVLIICAYAYA